MPLSWTIETVGGDIQDLGTAIFAKMLHAYASSDIKYKNRNNCTEILQTTRAYNSNTNTRTQKATQTDFPTYLQKLTTDSVGRSKIQNKEK